MKPTTITPNYDCIPEELRAQPAWVLWAYRFVDGEWRKVPQIADGSGNAAATNRPQTWRTFDEALAHVAQADGIGMIFTGPFAGIDLDCCRDKQSGTIAPWALRIVELLNSYTEISPSGQGIHVIVKLTKPLPQGGSVHGGKKKAGWEVAVYDRTSPRYFCMTGLVL